MASGLEPLQTGRNAQLETRSRFVSGHPGRDYRCPEPGTGGNPRAFRDHHDAARHSVVYHCRCWIRPWGHFDTVAQRKAEAEPIRGLSGLFPIQNLTTNDPGRRTRKMSVMNVELLKLGWRIRASRKKLGWSQKDFSSRCGMDRSYFGGVERGERNLTFSSLCQICTGLNCDIAAVTDGIPFPKEVPK
jgi:DNA-binding Xre family transcriptional regulator